NIKAMPMMERTAKIRITVLPVTAGCNTILNGRRNQTDPLTRPDSSRHPARGPHDIFAPPRRTSSPLLQKLIFGTDSIRCYNVLVVGERVMDRLAPVPG